MAHQKREKSRSLRDDPQIIRSAIILRIMAILRTPRTDRVTFNGLVGLPMRLPRATQEAAQKATHKTTLVLLMRLLRKLQPYTTCNNH